MTAALSVGVAALSALLVYRLGARHLAGRPDPAYTALVAEVAAEDHEATNAAHIRLAQAETERRWSALNREAARQFEARFAEHRWELREEMGGVVVWQHRGIPDHPWGCWLGERYSGATNGGHQKYPEKATVFETARDALSYCTEHLDRLLA